MADITLEQKYTSITNYVHSDKKFLPNDNLFYVIVFPIFEVLIVIKCKKNVKTRVIFFGKIHFSFQFAFERFMAYQKHACCKETLILKSFRIDIRVV